MQCLDLLSRQVAGNTVQHAKRADRLAAGDCEGYARVEPNVWRAAHQRVTGETIILRRIGDDRRFRPQDGVRAERAIARRAIGVDADASLEPLPFGVEQSDGCHRCIADAGSEPHQVIERAFGAGIEDLIPRERVEPL